MVSSALRTESKLFNMATRPYRLWPSFPPPNSHSTYPHNMFKLRLCYLFTSKSELPLTLGKIFNCNLILMLETETCINLTLLSLTFHLQTIINSFKFTFKIIASTAISVVQTICYLYLVCCEHLFALISLSTYNFH